MSAQAHKSAGAQEVNGYHPGHGSPFRLCHRTSNGRTEAPVEPKKPLTQSSVRSSAGGPASFLQSTQVPQNRHGYLGLHRTAVPESEGATATDGLDAQRSRDESARRNINSSPEKNASAVAKPVCTTLWLGAFHSFGDISPAARSPTGARPPPEHPVIEPRIDPWSTLWASVKITAVLHAGLGILDRSSTPCLHRDRWFQRLERTHARVCTRSKKEDVGSESYRCECIGECWSVIKQITTSEKATGATDYHISAAGSWTDGKRDKSYQNRILATRARTLRPSKRAMAGLDCHWSSGVYGAGFLQVIVWSDAYNEYLQQLPSYLQCGYMCFIFVVAQESGLVRTGLNESVWDHYFALDVVIRRASIQEVATGPKRRVAVTVATRDNDDLEETQTCSWGKESANTATNKKNKRIRLTTRERQEQLEL
ncbi:hypothetical protein BV22DRAFT_1115576 [Leucogyrophana mollusca]|uniref:Uncharacterized protein n=1 Tax=Leucogyrophana mollusca TaxID=85980 RepID=A0ACB8C0X7_9AGAM|nr:hypothetical protein BV22DRAFT_1115576 [Leucogyrophana mollusca]